MNAKNKFLYVFLIIITLGFIVIYWKKKYKQSTKKDYLSMDTRINFNIDDLISYLGGVTNIKEVSSTQKILKIGFLNKELINKTKIKELDGVSGIFFQAQNIYLVVGNTAKYLDEKINEVK